MKHYLLKKYSIHVYMFVRKALKYPLKYFYTTINVRWCPLVLLECSDYFICAVMDSRTESNKTKSVHRSMSLLLSHSAGKRVVRCVALGRRENKCSLKI